MKITTGSAWEANMGSIKLMLLACIALGCHAALAQQDAIHSIKLISVERNLANMDNQTRVTLEVEFTFSGKPFSFGAMEVWALRDGKPFAPVQGNGPAVPKGRHKDQVFLLFDPKKAPGSHETQQLAFAFSEARDGAERNTTRPFKVVDFRQDWGSASPPAAAAAGTANPWQQLLNSTVRNNVKPSASMQVVGSAPFTGPEAVQACAHHINDRPEGQGADKLNEVIRVEVLKATTAAEAGIPPAFLAGTKTLHPTRLIVALAPGNNLSFRFYLFRDGFNSLKCMGA